MKYLTRLTRTRTEKLISYNLQLSLPRLQNEAFFIILHMIHKFVPFHILILSINYLPDQFATKQYLFSQRYNNILNLITFYNILKTLSMSYTKQLLYTIADGMGRNRKQMDPYIHILEKNWYDSQ